MRRICKTVNGFGENKMTLYNLFSKIKENEVTEIVLLKKN